MAGQHASLAFDVTDLLLHFGARRTLTGIQRVQASLLGSALRRGMEASYLMLGEGGAWRAIPPALLADLLETAPGGAETEDPAWIAARDAVTEAAARGGPHRFVPGTTLLSLGSPWGIPGYFRAIRAAQRQAEVEYIPFLHDCVPLLMPEHCLRRLVQDYARWFAAMAVHARGIICNSASTRADGRRYLSALLPGLDFPMEAVRLDADPRSGAEPDPAALEGTRAPLSPEPYVLFVATIESRKDHLTVFRAWLTLLRRHGPGRIPRLVCVGSKGWHAEAALGLLEGSPELSREVVLLHGIPDGGLAALYRDSLFTVYNSHHEGWGLPVTESLAWGKVPVIPRHSALVESGEGLAEMVEPQSEGALVAALERLILEPAHRLRGEAAIARHGARRSWDAVLDDVLEAARRFSAALPMPRGGRVALPPGFRLSLRRSESLAPDLGMALAEAVQEGAGWRPAGPEGVAIRGGAARLRLPLPDGTRGRQRLHLEMAGAAGGGRIGFLLFANGAPSGAASIPEPPEGPFATALSIELSEAPETLELEIDAPPGTVLRGLMLCPEADLLARLDFLEGQALPAAGAA